MADSNVALVRSGVDSFNRGDLEAAVALFDPDVVIHDPARTGNTFRGHDGLRSFWSEWLENWSEYRVDPKEFVEEGDEVFVAVSQTGRASRSGIDVTQDLFCVYRIRDGKVVEYRLYTDREPALESMHG
jgi:uncharacterized protein